MGLPTTKRRGTCAAETPGTSAEARLQLDHDGVGRESQLLQDLGAGGVPEETLGHAELVDRGGDAGGARGQRDRGADSSADEAVLDSFGVGTFDLGSFLSSATGWDE